MMKNFFILVAAFILNTTFAQKAQKVGYVDMEYILENVPEYVEAQSKIDVKINKWNTTLERQKKNIEKLKLTLNNERALLTNDLVLEREEEIEIKIKDYKQTQLNYFGISGDLYMLRKQTVRPVQDQIFDAVQNIAKNKRYDIVFDKSSDLIMLYNNTKYDISELVLNNIVKGRKRKEVVEKKSERAIAKDAKKEELKDKIETRKSKQEELRERVKRVQEEKRARRDSLRQANIDKRTKRLEDIKRKRDALKNKGKDNKQVEEKEDTVREIETEKVNEVTEDVEKVDEVVEETKEVVEETKEEVVKTKEELREEKRQKMRDKIAKIQASKKAHRDSLRKIAEEKRAKKIAEIKERRKKLEENKNN
jgi:Skp family chaperone for outer membrane proteins